MEFIRYKDRDKTYLGIERDGKVLKLSDVIDGKDFSDILDFILNHKRDDYNKLSEISDYSQGKDIGDLEILSPFERLNHDMICVGVNYRDHIEDSPEIIKEEDIEETIYFTKRAEIISGPGKEIEYDFSLDQALDYESELGVVIGKKGKNIEVERAQDYIFGYTIVNDISARNLQRTHNQWYIGKSIDGFTSIGPKVVTRDKLKFPLELDIKSLVNGEERQSSNTRYMIRGVSQIIAELSKFITLVPGDIIATGTPKGVGNGFNPPKYLKDGDLVECYVEGIGSLKNSIRAI